MNRRRFVKHVGASIASGIVAPYILPSGRLFASSGKQLAKHVVFCLFAGGIRNRESVHQDEGNLMVRTLQGNPVISADILPGMSPLPAFAQKPLQSHGTLFREFRYRSDQTVHYNGHASAICGYYFRNLAFGKPVSYPTVFEYYRKHSNPLKSALNCWWVSDQGGPFPYLHYSNHPDYGTAYGANMIHPAAFLRNSSIKASFPFDHDDRLRALHIRQVLDKHYQRPPQINSVQNSEEDQVLLAEFIGKLVHDADHGNLRDPWGLGAATNDDMINIHVATKILAAFKPELLVVNMQDSDIAHSNFTEYCNNMRKADFALWKLWEAINAIPEMADNTVLIAAPEFGRNLKPNTLQDAWGRYAIDHTGDPTSKEIFCMIAGPSHIIRQGQLIDQQLGESIDIVPTIAHILGFHDSMPSTFTNGRVLTEAFM